jgi:predicted transposase YbfD/YdcC
MMEIEGAVVTIDAMGCQRAIAEKILSKKAHLDAALRHTWYSVDREEPVHVS